jgi:hypothetical protein
MALDTLDLPGWRIEFDRVATAAAFLLAPLKGPASCSCDPCCNWVSTRERLLPPELRELLDRLGIPFDREVEVYHNARLDSGLHSYGAWYHFFGRIMFGENESSPHLNFGKFEVWFGSKPALLPAAFAGHPVVRLDVSADVPWLSEIPETA